MLTYEKDVVPVKITAREAYKQSVGTEEYLNTLKDVYSDIQGNIDDGYTNAHFFYDSMNLVNRVYRELLAQDYNLTLEKEKTCYHLTVDWSDVDLDPNKKYILPMEGTDRFAKKDLDKWIFIGDGRTAEEAFHSTCLYHNDTFTVQGRDILDGPDWVKAIKPIEVEE